MKYMLHYYSLHNEELLGGWQTNYLPKVGDFATFEGVRYVVSKVYEPFQIKDFAPAHVNIVVTLEK